MSMLALPFPHAALPQCCSAATLKGCCAEVPGSRSVTWHHRKWYQGLTLIEMILVLVVMAVSASLAVVSMRAGIENRRAKQVLLTSKAIAHAVRMYQQEIGSLPTQANLSELISNGFLKTNEFAYPSQYTYSFVPSSTPDPSRWRIEALHSSGRLIRVENRGDSFAVTDSRGLFSS